jgi:hypothetical protein
MNQTTIQCSANMTSPVPFLPPNQNNCNIFYKVQQGDTCYKIALKNRLGSYENLISLNPGLSCNLSGGEWLCIANATFPTPCPSQRYYTVKSGDTCTSIAASVGLRSYTDLIKLNQVTLTLPDCPIWPDEVLCIGSSNETRI